VYAENPSNNFLPSTGKLNFLQSPESETNLRIESGVEEGGEVSIYYDPMIAKVVVWAKEGREAAMKKLNAALGEIILVD